MSQIKGSGSLDAKIVVISDHPGYAEQATGKTIAGTNENILKYWWRKHGLYRSDVRVENLYENVPRGNVIESVPVDTLVGSITSLKDRLKKCKKANVIVPLDNYSVFALTGKGKVKAALRKAMGEEDISTTMAEKKADIAVLRGSTYLYNGIKVIPSLHPQKTVIFEKWRKRTIRDWGIIVEESKTKKYVQPKKLHIVNPTEYELHEFWNNLDYKKHKMSIDIETWGKTISCVGFSIDHNISYTLPTVTKEDQALYWPWIKAFCECPVPKVLQNGLYDWYWLDAHGIYINNYLYDTLAMHHAIDPVESHDLAFLVSYFTRNNYWKDEAKDAEEIKKYASNLNALWVYNGLDCCHTRELSDILEQILIDRGMWFFYLRHYQTMFEPLMRLMRHGVNVDVKRQKLWAATLLRRSTKIRKNLAEVAGEDLYAKKGFSPTKLKKFFYKTLALPEQTKMSNQKGGRKRIVAMDEVALKRMSVKYPKKIGTHGLDVLKVRKLNKKASVLKKGWDKDERIRCTYKLTTEQGRLSSSKNPMGRGYNLQNIEREKGGIRTTFIPDEKCVFVRVDLSQSEDRFCKMYTRADRMVEIANRRPDKYDTHTDNARMIFNITDVTKEHRDIGKMAVHASYDQQTQILTDTGFVFADQLTEWHKVAQWNINDKKVTFVKPLDYFEYEYNDAMYRFRDGFVSQLVTKDHRIPYMTNNNLKWDYAENIPKEGKIPLNGYYSGNVKIDKNLIKLIVSTCADATLTKHNAFRWHLKKERKIARLIKILNELKYDYSVNTNKDNTVSITLFQNNSHEVSYWLPEKEFSKQLLKLCSENLNQLIDELQYWDGNKTQANSIRFRSSNQNNLNWVQIICHLRGKKASLVTNKATKTSFTNNDSYTLNISDYKYSKAGKAHIEYGKRKVYCLTVPSGFVVIKRNNCISITGNSQRGMTGKTLSDRLMAKMDVIKTPKQCQNIIDAYLARNPEIKSVYFPFVRTQIINGGLLGNSWGRILDLSGYMIDQNLYRKGYSFYLQSENVDLINQKGLKPLMSLITREKLSSRVNMQVHDDLISSCAPNEAYYIAKFLVESLEQPRMIMGNMISIPACISVGFSLDSGETFEWNIVPAKSEFDDKVKELEEINIKRGEKRRGNTKKK